MEPMLKGDRRVVRAGAGADVRCHGRPAVGVASRLGCAGTVAPTSRWCSPPGRRCSTPPLPSSTPPSRHWRSAITVPYLSLHGIDPGPDYGAWLTPARADRHRGGVARPRALPAARRARSVPAPAWPSSRPRFVDERASDLVSVEGAVGTITLNRPGKRNAVTYDMWVALDDALSPTGDRPRRAGGRAARRGRPLLRRCRHHRTARRARLPAPRRSWTSTWPPSTRWPRCPSPPSPWCRATASAAAARWRSTATCARGRPCSRFGITPAKLGIVYPPASLERAVRLLGPAAKRLLYTGDLIDAAEAHRIGLVDELLPADEIEARAGRSCAPRWPTDRCSRRRRRRR